MKIGGTGLGAAELGDKELTSTAQVEDMAASAINRSARKANRTYAQNELEDLIQRERVNARNVCRAARRLAFRDAARCVHNALEGYGTWAADKSVPQEFVDILERVRRLRIMLGGFDGDNSESDR
jgi:hypothetical protein